MPKIYTENLLISVHTMIKKNPIKQILSEENIEEVIILLEDYIKGLALDLNGVSVEVEFINNNDSD
jgi:hypothetical protein